ncbi:MAG TPA: F0F1 ATP synthase subunit epsilon [Phycisphaerae bacterium]|nr:F0F1 ATP synthase subunit epsilon [Phycisphaerae bacterium]HQL71899.1 F0F1 ATP synthase subunit epsilon [Phycisphaerae bacterium]
MASQYNRSFKLELVTPHGRVATMDVYSVVFPASDGQVGVLAGRAPVAAIVGAGGLVADTIEGNRIEYFVAGGFANMTGDHLTLLAEQCVPVGQVDREQAWDDLEAARKLPYGPRREVAVEIARARFDLVQRHLSRTGQLTGERHDLE